MKKRISFLMALLLIAAALTLPALAAGTFVIDDGADLLTASEEAELRERYAGITEYMDAAFVTTDYSSGTTEAYAENYAIRHYGNDPAVIFLIDMDDREIYVYANGEALKTISRADARAITDNIYKDASRGDYFACADGAFGQILAKCQGARLARPVKHITNAMIAVLFGVLINYLITVRSRRPSAERRTKGTVTASVSHRPSIIAGIALAAPIVIGSVRHYHNDDSGSGGGGGGGGHSGGGGGHSF